MAQEKIKVVCQTYGQPPKIKEVNRSVVKTALKFSVDSSNYRNIPIILDGLEGNCVCGLIHPQPRTIIMSFPTGSLGWQFLDDLDLVVKSDEERKQLFFVLVKKDTEDIA